MRISRVMFASPAQVMRDVLRLCRIVMCCVPLSCAEAHITSAGRITREAHITFRAAEHIVQKSAFCPTDKRRFFVGGEDGIRTHVRLRAN